MSRYYCPFCSSRYQFHTTRTDGTLICGQCGDPLMKRPLINGRQIISLLAASTFIIPLIFVFIFAIKEFNREKVPNNSDSLVLLIIK